MRVAIVTESFLPNVNGVTNSVLRVLECLRQEGHEAMVIAPGARDFQEEIPDYLGFPIHRVPTVMVPFVNSLPVGVPGPSMVSRLRDFQPDVVHLASPFVLAGAGAFAAKAAKVPAVALYQTDVAGFASRYHLGPMAKATWYVTRAIHNACQRTLAPSSPAIAELEEHGIRDIYRWGRGVDTHRFNPVRRNESLRKKWDPTQRRRIVGFVGRLASEKGVERLAVLESDPDIQIVIVGDGPERPKLHRLMPSAHFTGELGGTALAEAYASMDVFVHPGEFETFCQTIQEAQASGVPTIAPRAGGPVDLISDDVNGRMLDVETFTEDLPRTVAWALDPVINKELSRNAVELVQERTWPALCDQLLGHYEAAIETFHQRGKQTKRTRTMQKAGRR